MKILTREAFNILTVNRKSNIDKYLEHTPWLDNYFSGIPYEFETNLSLEKAPLIISNNSKDDFNNIKIFYENYKELSLEEASDARLWTYFAHKRYYDYTFKRWILGSSITDSKIRERFFYSRTGKGKLRNALARLWWYGKATYDESYEDPYTLTKILIAKQDIAQNIFERNFSRNSNLTKNILKVIYKMEQNNETLPKREEFRTFSKALIRTGAFAITDILNEEQIENMLRDCIK